LPEFRRRRGIQRPLPSAFDDTNPTKEEQESIDAIKRDVRWLGFDWGENLYHASDYFDRLYEWAEHPIRAGKAYIDDQSQDEIRLNRGTLTEPGKNSPHRDRSVEENLDLFRRMKAGKFPNGARVLRAKIDMSSGNINLRDPVLYRILHATHPRTGDAWSIYPSDFATASPTPSSTSRIDLHARIRGPPSALRRFPKTSVPSHPHQYDPARLDLLHGAVKRVLTELIFRAHVSGWDDRACRPSHSTAAGSARSNPRFRPPRRHRQGQQRRRRRNVRSRGARISQQTRRPPHGGPAPAQGRDREVSETRSGRSGRLPSETPAPVPPRAFNRQLISRRGLHGKSAEEILPPLSAEVRLRYAFSSPAAKR
jgi:hypothetical protein